MSHSTLPYAAHPTPASDTDIHHIPSSSSRTAQLRYQVTNPPVQPDPPRLLRPSHSHSTLADSIRALRDSSSISNTNPTSLSAASSPVESLASRRRANKPSPLPVASSSHNTKLYLREGLHSPLSPTSPFALPTLPTLPSTPRDRLDALFSPPVGSPSRDTSVANLSPRTVSDSNALRQQSSYGQLRKPSLPSILSHPRQTPPPLSPTTLTQLRPNIGSVMPRNPSIDSTVSSVSSTSQLARPVQAGVKGNADNDENFDPASYVAQAGSVEAALHHLWKENQNSTAHNSQLWRLVEKQRSILLGLQKDLDKACKERERYRKKLKDHLAQCSSSLTGALPQASSLQRRDTASPSPAPSEPISEYSSKTLNVATNFRNASSQASSEAPSPKFAVQPTPSTSRKPVATRNSPLEKLMDQDQSFDAEEKRRTAIAIPPKAPQSPVSPLGSSSDRTSLDASPVTSISAIGEHSLERMGTPLTEPSVVTEVSPIEREPPAKKIEAFKPPAVSIVGAKATPPPSSNPPAPPSVAITNPTPIVDAGSFPSPPKPSMANRKPVPKPLNLVQSNLSPSHEKSRFADLSPIIAVRDAGQVAEEVDRGRRRTRRDDDMAREAIAIKEEEVRSLSKKSVSKKSKSKSTGTTPLASPSTTPSLQHPSTSIIAASPKIEIPPSPRLPPPNASSLLSPVGSESSMHSTRIQHTSLTAPLLSPGLPMSPRPGHRPANSPAPRHPKQNLSISSVSNSPPSPAAQTPSTGSSLQANASPAFAPVQSLSVKEPDAVPSPLFSKKKEPPIQVDPPRRDAPKAPVSAPVVVDNAPIVPQVAAPVQPPMAHPAPVVTSSMDPVPTQTGSKSEAMATHAIFTGLVSDQYPGLLLPPNALPSIDVKVFSSRLRPSRNSIMLSLEEDPVFLLGIYARSDGRQLWRLEKTSQALPSLHAQVKSLCQFDGRLPDASLFQGHSPAKIDARRAALNAYFDMLLDTPLNEDAALVVCHFFSTDVMEPEKEPVVVPVAPQPKKGSISKLNVRPLRDGYLTKRGKNFGGWKARYFVLDGPELRYYDSPSGPQIGTIKLYHAQIGKQSNNRASAESPMGRTDDDNQYRHAFLILEPKKKDSSSLVRHVLCAESDEERDAWVEACMAYVDVLSEKKTRQSTVPKGSGGPTSQAQYPNLVPAPLQAPQQPTLMENNGREASQERDTTPSSQASMRDNPGHESRAFGSSNTGSIRRNESSQPRSSSRLEQEQNQTLGVSYESTIQAEAPIIGHSPYHTRNSPDLSNGSFPRSQQMMPNNQSQFSISGPKNGSVISDMASWGLKTPAREKKRSIFGFGSRGRSSSDTNTPQLGKEPSPARATPVQMERSTLRNVFGMPLAEAIEISPPEGVDAQIPAVVYRCIEYLRAMKAVDEEGLFRLSGSNVTIKGLRERFQVEGDVNLLEGEYYDIHAVASLLKLYLRELPNSILTRDLHMEFLELNKIKDPQNKDKETHEKVLGASMLMQKVPEPNYYLLKALCSFLMEVAGNSDRNKMTVRNLGIVFAPTLNLPAWLIQLFTEHFDEIFSDTFVDDSASPIKEVLVEAPPPPDAIRSPRHQMFSDLPTPAHNQTSFAGFQPMGAAQPVKQMQRSTYVPTGSQQHAQYAPQPHNEYAGPQQAPYGQQYQHQSYHPQYQYQPSMNSQQGGHADGNYGSLNGMLPQGQQQLGPPESRRNRRESAMMGMDIGLVGQRQAPRQTLRE
ncbi:hypothetical protein BT63DRAFT_416413 [Microthyrium microscopicum]|uniref:RhoGAP-domain-containing protein n=1 Tax=Microthyrium microscopicum TaxID=703497 RepID=A0A6A6U0Z8_9PEZI|nr:hypothetical protein BT63DRAFT_416413 [Microthyrium microscopicum]